MELILIPVNILIAAIILAYFMIVSKPQKIENFLASFFIILLLNIILLILLAQDQSLLQQIIISFTLPLIILALLPTTLRMGHIQSKKHPLINLLIIIAITILTTAFIYSAKILKNLDHNNVWDQNQNLGNAEIDTSFALAKIFQYHSEIALITILTILLLILAFAKSSNRSCQKFTNKHSNSSHE